MLLVTRSLFPPVKLTLMQVPRMMAVARTIAVAPEDAPTPPVPRKARPPLRRRNSLLVTRRPRVVVVTTAEDVLVAAAEITAEVAVEAEMEVRTATTMPLLPRKLLPTTHSAVRTRARPPAKLRLVSSPLTAVVVTEVETVVVTVEVTATTVRASNQEVSAVAEVARAADVVVATTPTLPLRTASE